MHMTLCVYTYGIKLKSCVEVVVGGGGGMPRWVYTSMQQFKNVTPIKIYMGVHIMKTFNTMVVYTGSLSPLQYSP